jgi:hypothetical protein
MAHTKVKMPKVKQVPVVMANEILSASAPQ